MKGNLPSDFLFPYSTALGKIRKSLKGNKNTSPLETYENWFVEIILCMNRLKRSLTSSEGLGLVNEIIAVTIIQHELIDYKLQHHIYYESMKDLGQV